MGTGNDTPDLSSIQDAQIDLATITDVKELKAMAYDRLSAMELFQNELRAINERIAQLSMQAEAPVHNGRVTSKAKT